MAKVTIELDDDMLYNLRVMGGHTSNEDALMSAEKDIGNILRDGRLGIPVVGGRLQVGVFASGAKNAWIEFQHENGVCIDLALVDTEFKNDGLGRGRQRLLGGRCRYCGSPLLIVVDAD